MGAQLQSFWPNDRFGAMGDLISRFRSAFFGVKSWRDIEYFDPSWKRRIKEMAAYIPLGSSVLDLGCGKMWLRQYIPTSPYYPVDYKDRGPGTLVCDFNLGQFPVQNTDVAFASGALEYVGDLHWFISCISKYCNQCVISYCVLEDYPDLLFRRKQAWLNNYSRKEIIQLFIDAGFRLDAENQNINKNRIFYFVKAS
jgi:hypothetical protein